MCKLSYLGLYFDWKSTFKVTKSAKPISQIKGRVGPSYAEQHRWPSAKKPSRDHRLVQVRSLFYNFVEAAEDGVVMKQKKLRELVIIPEAFI